MSARLKNNPQTIKILIYSSANVGFCNPVSLGGPGVEGGRRQHRSWAANGKGGCEFQSHLGDGDAQFPLILIRPGHLSHSRL